MARLILDTGVVVDFSRWRRESTVADDLAVPAIVLAEYRQGIHLDRNRQCAQSQAEFLDHLLERAPVVDYTADVAEHHAELMVHTSREGRPRGKHDLIIAATARADGRVLVTTDKRARFDGLPGVQVRVV